MSGYEKEVEEGASAAGIPSDLPYQQDNPIHQKIAAMTAFVVAVPDDNRSAYQESLWTVVAETEAEAAAAAVGQSRNLTNQEAVVVLIGEAAAGAGAAAATAENDRTSRVVESGAEDTS